MVVPAAKQKQNCWSEVLCVFAVCGSAPSVQGPNSKVYIVGHKAVCCGEQCLLLSHSCIGLGALHVLPRQACTRQATTLLHWASAQGAVCHMLQVPFAQ